MAHHPKDKQPAEAPAQRARSRGFDVHLGTLAPGLFPAASFVAVLGWRVVEHLPEPKHTLREIHRILTPQGYLAFSVPNFACWERAVFGSYWYSLQLPTHYQQFTPRTIRSLLAQTEFRLVKLIHQRNVLNITGSLALWLREALPRRAWGPRLLQLTNGPSMWGYLALATPARILSWLRQTVGAAPGKR